MGELQRALGVGMRGLEVAQVAVGAGPPLEDLRPEPVARLARAVAELEGDGVQLDRLRVRGQLRLAAADMLFESELTRYGFADYWTTGDTTWTTSTDGRFALVDVAAHEFGHFAGLDHVDRSPGLTMYPLIHDGMQTLGLGDMHGLLARY
jgi:hypothetical protein